MDNIDTSLYGTNSNTIPNKSANDNDFENRLYFTLLNKNMKNCNNLNSTNMSNCLDYYNNTPNNITNRLNSEYNNANTYIYSNPVNAKFQNYPIFDESNCRPISGKNRKYNGSASYTFPIINIHDKYITDNFTTTQIQSIKNLKINENISFTALQTNESIKFTRTNDIYPEQYRLDRTYNCNDKPYRTSTYIDSLWRQNTGCTMQLSQNIFNNLNTNYDDLQYIVNDTDVINKFNPYKLENITSNYEKFKECYGRDNISSYVTINEGNKSRYTAGSILLPGFKFNKLSGTDGIIILRNGDFTLKILDTGAINIYGLNNVILFNGLTIRSNSSSPIQNNEICMQHEGNLIISNINNSIIWNSGTNGNNGAYLELATNSSLMIKKSNGDILKYLYISPNQLNTTWKDSTKCTQDLSDGILTSMNTNYTTVSVLDSIAKVIEVFNPFTANSLISNPNTDKIKLCYGDHNNTGYVTVNTNNRSNYTARAIFPPGIRIAVKGIIILTNGTYRYRITNNGGCGLVNNPSGTTIDSLMEHSYTESNFGSIVMEHGGNLVIFSNQNPSNILWQSGTGGNPGAYLELESNGSLYIKNKSGTTIIKYLYISSNQLNTTWKDSTKCTQDLSNGILTSMNTNYPTVSILDNIAKVIEVFNPFTTNSLISNKDTQKIKLCYGDNNNTGYVIVNNTNKSNYTTGSIFPPGIRITVKDIDIVQNSNYRLLINNNGKLVYVNKLDNSTNNILFSPNYTLSDFGYIVMEHGGNLVIFSNQNPSNILWQSNTGNNNGAYLELDTNGSLYIKRGTTIIKYLYIESGVINTAWKEATGCSQDLSANVYTNINTTMSDLQLLSNIETDVKPKFNPFTANSLISNPNTNNIKLCYGDNNNTSYVTVNTNNRSNYTAGSIFPPGIRIAVKGIIILTNGTYKYRIDSNGGCGLVNTSGTQTSSLMEHSYTSSSFGYIVMQHDGNLVIFSNAASPSILWQSNTGNNNGAYLELTTNGSLIIKNSSGTIIKYLYIESGIINTAWKEATGCTQDLSANVYTNINTTMSDLQLLSNIETDVKPKFNPYTKMNLYKDIPNSADKISTCYNGYVTYTRDDLMDSNSSIKSGLTVPNKINKGMFFRTGPTGDILILRSSSNNWELWLNTSGQLIISNSYTNFQISERIVPASATTTNSTNNIFTFQTDGNVVLWHNGNVVWSLGTVPIPDANHLHLTNLGHLVLLKANNQRERLVWDNTKNWLRTYFYDNCPNAMFADKAGRFFKFIWSEYSSGYTINDVSSNDCCRWANQFRGWGLDGVLKDDNFGWNVTQRNLININGYDRELNTDKPNKSDTPEDLGDNYCTKEDRDNFFNDGGTATINTNKIRKPKQFTTGGLSKSNYLPGYIRISYVNGTTNSDNSFKFLIMDRGASQRNQAFVLFQKFHDRNTFTDSVFGNHPDLVNVIQSHSI